MTGTTVPLGFPYPTGTDRVADGDNAIQALADAVDDFFVGTSAALANGAITNASTTSTAYKRGQMGFIRVEGWLGNAGTGAGAILATVPVGYRPPVSVRFLLWDFTASAIRFCELKTDGTVSCSSAIPTGNAVYGSAAYPL